MNNKKGLAKPAVILVVAIVLIITGGIWYYEVHRIYPTATPVGDNLSTAASVTNTTTTSVSQASNPIPHSVVSSDEAIAIVMKLPDVQEWMQAFPNGTSPTTGGHPGFAISSETTSTYVVWVFEDNPDQDVTFNYYDVNKATGSVTPEE